MTDDDDLADLQAYSLPGPDASPEAFAARVMRYPEHQHLADNEITFGWLMRHEPKVKGGRTELGSVHETASMAQGGFRDLFEQLLAGMLGHLPQFVVVINLPWWEQASEMEREALVFHELAHVRQKVDKYGAPRFNVQTGLPVYGIHGHDVEEFTSVVARYGLWKSDLREFVAVAQRSS